MQPVIGKGLPAKVTVGTTAATLQSLLGVTLDITPLVVELYADGGDIRYTMSPDFTPDATTGFVLADGQTRIFENLEPRYLKLYAATDTTIQVQVGSK